MAVVGGAEGEREAGTDDTDGRRAAVAVGSGSAPAVRLARRTKTGGEEDADRPGVGWAYDVGSRKNMARFRIWCPYVGPVGLCFNVIYYFDGSQK